MLADGSRERGAVTLTHVHHLVLPTDANHHGTLYAGSLLRLALEAGYATAWRHVGTQANLVLRRVLNLECLRPVPVGFDSEAAAKIQIRLNSS
jgi:acyl-CoA hydrolase